MKKIKIIVSHILFFILAFVLISCSSNKDTSVENSTNADGFEVDEDGNTNETVTKIKAKMRGTILADEKFTKSSNSVKEKELEEKLLAINLEKDNKGVECVYGDFESDISVWVMINGGDQEFFASKGVIIRKDGKNTCFPNVYHGNNALAALNEENGDIIFAGGYMEGTGTHIEVLYLFKLNQDGIYEINNVVSPFEIQNEIIDKIDYSIEGNEITFIKDNKAISNVTNLEDGMGMLEEIWVGEQISYEFDDDNNIKVSVVPGKKFVTGLVLLYDDMPTFEAKVRLTDNGFTLENLKVIEE